MPQENKVIQQPDKKEFTVDLTIVHLERGRDSPLFRAVPAGRYVSYDAKRGYAQSFESDGVKLVQTGGGPSLIELMRREGAGTVFLTKDARPARLEHIYSCLETAGYNLTKIDLADFAKSGDTR